MEDLSNSLKLMVSSSLICAIVGMKKLVMSFETNRSGMRSPTLIMFPPADEFLVLDADASQSYVINAGVAGIDLVVQGPPGTGKSQTIANLIASLSARGIRTLFVAEKRAAIEAVVKRLKKVGLGDLVLDLHETTGTRAKVIAELDRSLHSASSTPFIDYSAGHQDLERRRAELFERAKTLAIAQQPWGISISDIFCELPGFEDQVRLEGRISGARLEDMVPTVLLEYQDDVERFVTLGGLPLIDGTSVWSNALTNGTITTVAEVQNVRNTIRQVQSADLPDTGLRLPAGTPRMWPR